MGTKRGTSVEERFFAKVEKTPTCWLWTAAKTTNGYGMFGSAARTVTTAHRWSYMLHIGPIPEGLQVDHLCHVRACVNPAHLEAVTAKENIRRRLPRKPAGRCIHDHILDAENTYINPKGGRVCRTCMRAAKVASLERKRAA